jgi:hypothetical protein
MSKRRIGVLVRGLDDRETASRSMTSPLREPPLGCGRLGTFPALCRDPFVLSVAAGGAAPLSPGVGVAAILLAASTNNLANAGYVAGFAGGHAAAAPAGALCLLALAGGSAAWWISAAADSARQRAVFEPRLLKDEDDRGIEGQESLLLASVMQLRQQMAD